MTHIKCGHILILCFSVVKLVKSKNVSFNIIGGEYASIHDFTYSAYLTVIYIEFGIEYGSRCGASVLSQRLMLTAAHCFDETSISLVETRVGHSHKNQGTLNKVDKYLIHEGYRRNTINHDIAMFRVSKDLALGQTVERVAVMRTPPPEAAEVAGWGLISDSGERDKRLKVVRQRVMRRQACVERIGRIREGMFCARHVTGYTGSGDSGSALVVRRYIEIGIVSFSRDKDKMVTVYANTSYYFDWIESHARILSCYD